MKLSLVFPVYNEADVIVDVATSFVIYSQNHGLEFELILVDDGSRDGTQEKIDQLAHNDNRVRMVHHPTNQGYGAALRSGFQAATGDYIFFTDSDGQFRPDDLQQTIPKISPQTMIVGYRRSRADAPWRRLNAWLWSRWVKLILGVSVRDLNCAWKVFPRSLLSHSTLTSRGALINAELLYRAQQQHMQIEQIPVHHYNRTSGSPTGAQPKVIWRAFIELWDFARRRSSSATLPESAE